MSAGSDRPPTPVSGSPGPGSAVADGSVTLGSGGRLEARIVVRRAGFVLDAALTAEPGQVTAVLGPNGSGKSTLLRALAGLEPCSGRVVLGGRVLDQSDVTEEPHGSAPVEEAERSDRHVPVAERRVGLVFQDLRLLPHLRARDDVALGLRARGMSKRDARAQAEQWLERLGVGAQAGSRPDQLSGGQAQRVALARTLAAGPDLLLLDEPLAALDAETRASTRTWLRRHCSAFAGPSLVVTHDPLEAMTLADRVLVLEHGRVVQQGTPAEVARRPATRWIGRLVGLNVLTGRLSDGVLRTPAGGLVIVGGSAPVPRSAVDAVVALRPSAVTLHTAPPPPSSTRNTWLATLSSLEPYGDRVRATLEGVVPLLVDLTLDAVAELALRPGVPVWATAKATDLETY